MMDSCIVPQSIACCICQRETSGGHRCNICKRFCHTICGKTLEEGYGCAVTCTSCLAAADGIAEAELDNISYKVSYRLIQLRSM